MLVSDIFADAPDVLVSDIVADAPDVLVLDIFVDAPNIQAFMTAMAPLPGVQEYLASRPSLVDVGTALVLMQNGEVIKPGFE